MELLALVLPLLRIIHRQYLIMLTILYKQEFSTKSHELSTLAGLLPLSFGLELPRV